MMRDDPAKSSLASIDLLSNLPQDVLGEVEDACRLKNFPQGMKLIEQGEDGQDVFFILSGSAHVLNYSSSERIIAFASLGEGEFFGEMAAIDGQPRSATVVSATSCTVAILPGAEFRRLIAGHTAISFSLLKRMSQVIRACDDRIFNLTLLGASQRVCLELLRLAEPNPSGSGDWAVYSMPTQSNIATGIGTTRETVARTFRQLSDSGIIEKKARTLYIRDRKRLEANALQVEWTG